MKTQTRLRAEVDLEMIRFGSLGLHILVVANWRSRKWRLIVDSGATHSILAENAWLPAARPADEPVHGIVGNPSLNTGLFRVSGMKIGGVILPSADWIMMDLGAVNQVYREAGYEPPDGLLGGDLLKKIHAVLNYGSSTLRFYRNPYSPAKRIPVNLLAR